MVQALIPDVVTLGEARHGSFLQCNAGADVVQAPIPDVVTLGKARHGCFLQCNAVQMWYRHPFRM